MKWKKKTIKEMRDKKATGDEDVPGDVLKVLREDDLRIMRWQINNIYESKEWLTLQWFQKCTSKRYSCKLHILNVHTFSKKSMKHLQVLRASRMTKSKFHIEDRKFWSDWWISLLSGTAQSMWNDTQFCIFRGVIQQKLCWKRQVPP